MCSPTIRSIQQSNFWPPRPSSLPLGLPPSRYEGCQNECTKKLYPALDTNGMLTVIHLETLEVDKGSTKQVLR